MTVVQLAVPFVFALFGCIVEETFPSESRDFDPLVIKFSHFDDPISPYKGACLSRHVTYETDVSLLYKINHSGS